jgi:hypothetical protein
MNTHLPICKKRATKKSMKKINDTLYPEGDEQSMSNQIKDLPVRPDEAITPSSTGHLPALRKRKRAVFWPWFGGLLLVGLVLTGIITLSVRNWFNSLQIGTGANTSAPAITTMKVGRTAVYVDLNLTWTTVQSATYFADDPIHSGPEIVRVNLSVTNPTGNIINTEYYDGARLLVGKQAPIAPANLTVPGVMQKNSTRAGWIDFPVAEGTDLSSLKLQLGNASVQELLVTVPVSGTYDGSQYALHSYHPSLTVTYNFKPWGSPVTYDLIYHLTSVDVRDSYNGVETHTNQQYYVLNFSVDNPNGTEVDPGYGYDYLRLSIGGNNRPPMNNTMPLGYKPNAHGIGGSVAFIAPANMHHLTIVFMVQSQAGWNSYDVSW